MDQLLENLDGVRRLAGALVSNPDDAEDVAQETALAALESPPRAGWDLRAWLGGVARNKARRMQRTESRLRRREHKAARKESVPSTAEVAARMAEQKHVLDAITRLTPAQQQVIWLRFFEDLPPRVIATRLDVPVETVRTRTKRALARLRRHLDDRHGGRRSAWIGALLPFVEPGRASSHPSWIGGALMTAKSKTMAAILVVALLCLGLYHLLSSEDGRSDLSTEETATTGPSEAPAALKTRERTAGEKQADEVAAASNSWRFPVLVQTPSDRPIAEAEVRIGSTKVLAWERLTLAGTTNTEGRYEARLDPDAGSVRVVAVAEGRLPVATTVHPPAKEPVLLRLPTVRMLHFIVRDGDTGKPIPGVLCESFGAVGGFEVVSRSQTDESGRATLRDSTGHRLDFQQRLRFLRDGYVPRATIGRQLLEAGTATAGNPRVIYLFPGRALRLRVVDARGRPVPGATVKAWTGSTTAMPSLVFGPEAPDHSYAGSMPLGSAIADDKGVVTLGVPMEGWHAWFAVAHAEGRAGFEFRKRFAGRKDIEADIYLYDAYRIEGVVVDEDDKPVPGADVGYGLYAVARGVDPQLAVPGAPPELAAGTKTVTDGEGRFVLENVPIPERSDRGPPHKSGTGGLPVFAQCAGMEHKVEHLTPPAAGERVLRTRIVMQRSPETLRVRVRDVEGRPIPGAWVTWRRVRPYARTDEDGRAVISRLPGDMLPLLVTARGYGDWLADYDGSWRGELEVTLRPGRAIAGRVEDATGVPSAAYVDVFRAETAKLPDAERAKMQIYGKTWITRVHAADDGRFHVRDAPAEALFLRAWRWVTNAKGGPNALQAEGLFEPGQDVVLRLSEPESGPGGLRAISGSVRTAGGKRLTRYNLQLRPVDPQPGKGRWFRPVQSGWTFRFEGIPPGDYEIQATQPDGAWRGRHPIQVPSGRDLSNVLVKVIESGTLRGRLVLPEGLESMPPGVMAWPAAGKGGFRGYGAIDGEGRFTIPNLEPGRYTLRLQSRPGTPRQWQAGAGEHTVKAASETDIELRLVAAGRVVLVLDNERFATNANMAHLLRDEERGRRTLSSKVSVTSEAGVVRTAQGLLHGRHPQVWALPPGTYHLRVDAGDEGSFETSVKVRGHADSEIRVRLVK